MDDREDHGTDCFGVMEMWNVLNVRASRMVSPLQPILT